MRLSPSEQAKKAGLKSFAELTKLSRVAESTLLDWHKTKQHLFSLVLAGVVITKQNGGEA